MAQLLHDVPHFLSEVFNLLQALLPRLLLEPLRKISTLYASILSLGARPVLNEDAVSSGLTEVSSTSLPTCLGIMFQAPLG